MLVQTLCSGRDLFSGSVASESYGYWQAGLNLAFFIFRKRVVWHREGLYKALSNHSGWQISYLSVFKKNPKPDVVSAGQDDFLLRWFVFQPALCLHVFKIFIKRECSVYRGYFQGGGDGKEAGPLEILVCLSGG